MEKVVLLYFVTLCERSDVKEEQSVTEYDDVESDATYMWVR